MPPLRIEGTFFAILILHKFPLFLQYFQDPGFRNVSEIIDRKQLNRAGVSFRKNHP